MEEFEHALFMLLLLVGVLTARPPRRDVALWALAVGFLLAFIPPAVRLPIPWDLILALTIPLLLWQNARRLVSATWRGNGVELALWALTVAAFGLVLSLDVNLGILGALLFGLLAASILWQAIEPEFESSHISLLGPLTLVFLLAETAPAVETPDRFIGGLFSGAAVGIAVAFLAIRLTRRMAPSRVHWIALGQVYVAYGAGLALDSSGVVAALLSVMVYVETGLRRGFWAEGLVRPAPLNTWPGFGLALLLLMFLGWETHRPLSGRLLLEVGLGTGVGVLIAWLGRRLGVTFFRRLALEGVLILVVLWLFPALLLWPRTTLLAPLPLALALGAAGLVSVLSAAALPSLISSLQDDQEDLDGD